MAKTPQKKKAAAGEPHAEKIESRVHVRALKNCELWLGSASANVARGWSGTMLESSAKTAKAEGKIDILG